MKSIQSEKEGKSENLIQIKRLFDVPYYQLKHYPLNEAFSHKEKNKWKSISIAAFIEKCATLSRGLLRLGVSKGDKVAIISSYSCTSWHVIDIAVSQTGAQLVPIYPNVPEKDYEYILTHSEASYCFVSDEEIFKKLENIKNNVPSLKSVYSFESFSNCVSWDVILLLGEDFSNQVILEEIKSSIKKDDVATVIYTSGTTGTPKGVMLTHDNIISNILGCKVRFPVKKGSVALSFLPISHIYERMLIYLYVFSGVHVYFAESLDTIGENIREVRPHIITVVPRFLEKIYTKIYKKGTGFKGIKKLIFLWAIRIGSHYIPFQKKSFLGNLRLLIARKFVFSKWRKALGGRLLTIVSGSAPLQSHIAKIFSATGISILEGYGLTETSPVVSVGDSNIGDIRLGAVGKPLDGMEVKIANDGEILCRGDSVMKGYYKDELLTNQVIKDGYFHTGDIGYFDNDGFLYVTGRKKEMFKTSGGKYIVPQLIENQIKISPFIEQIIVLGEGKKMPTAIIQPDFDHLQEWASNLEIDTSSLEKLLKEERVIARFQMEIDFSNENFSQWERIKKFILIPNTWTIENGYLTPTRKPKRKKILSKYKDLYEGMYAE